MATQPVILELKEVREVGKPLDVNIPPEKIFNEKTEYRGTWWWDYDQEHKHPIGPFQYHHEKGFQFQLDTYDLKGTRGDHTVVVEIHDVANTERAEYRLPLKSPGTLAPTRNVEAAMPGI